MKKLFAILATSVVLILASCTDNSNNFVPVKETLYQKGSDTTITSKQFKLLKGDPKKVVNSCGKTVTIRKSYLDSIVSTSGLTLQGAPVTEQLYKKEVPAPAGIGNGNDDSDNGSIRSGSNHAGLFGLGLPDWAWWILFFILLVLLGLLIWALTRNRHNTHDHNHGTVNHNHTGTVNHSVVGLATHAEALAASARAQESTANAMTETNRINEQRLQFEKERMEEEKRQAEKALAQKRGINITLNGGTDNDVFVTFKGGNNNVVNALPVNVEVLSGATQKNKINVVIE